MPTACDDIRIPKYIYFLLWLIIVLAMCLKNAGVERREISEGGEIIDTISVPPAAIVCVIAEFELIFLPKIIYFNYILTYFCYRTSRTKNKQPKVFCFLYSFCALLSWQIYLLSRAHWKVAVCNFWKGN